MAGDYEDRVSSCCRRRPPTPPRGSNPPATLLRRRIQPVVPRQAGPLHPLTQIRLHLPPPPLPTGHDLDPREECVRAAAEKAPEAVALPWRPRHVTDTVDPRAPVRTFISPLRKVASHLCSPSTIAVQLDDMHDVVQCRWTCRLFLLAFAICFIAACSCSLVAAEGPLDEVRLDERGGCHLPPVDKHGW